MGRPTKKSRRRDLLTARMEAAAARGDDKTLIRLNNALTKLDAKPRPRGIQPTSQAGKRLAKQEARSRALAAARQAYTASQIARHTWEPTAVPPTPQGSVQPSPASVSASLDAQQERDGRERVLSGILADARRQAETDNPYVRDEFAGVQSARHEQAAKAAAAPQPAVSGTEGTSVANPVTKAVSTADISNPETRAMLAKVNERIAERDRVAVEKAAAEKLAAEKAEATAKVEAVRREAEKKIMSSPRYRPPMGVNPLLPRPDYTDEGLAELERQRSIRSRFDAAKAESLRSKDLASEKF
jgi:colicin import membrane protein